MKIAYFFCTNSTKDKVAPAAFDACRRLLPMIETDVQIDGMSILRQTGEDGNDYHFVPTHEVLSHDFERYVPLLNRHFADFDLLGIVNWHQGDNAPDPIFCVHTTGDVPSGVFGAANPRLTTAVLLAMEKSRIEAGLDHWQTLPEATHFSGIQYGASPEAITKCSVPVIDIEIGSSPASWSDERAHEVLARSLIRLGESIHPHAASILFCGGMHFESSMQTAIVQSGGLFDCSHILPNQWVVSGDYKGEQGVLKLRKAIESIRGGIQGLVFHEGMKGAFKDTVRNLGAELRVPVIKHRRLRDGAAALHA